ncbi:MAG: alginate lyase family protein [Planctomycetota bacterium]
MQIAADGAQPHEVNRTLSFTYCTYNLLGFTCVAQVARNHGSDLWNWQCPDGRSLRSALQWMFPYYRKERTWAHPQIKAFDLSSATLLTLAQLDPSNAVPKELTTTLEQHPWQRVIFSKASLAARKVPGAATKP